MRVTQLLLPITLVGAFQHQPPLSNSPTRTHHSTATTTGSIPLSASKSEASVKETSQDPEIPAAKQQRGLVMSESIPFLKCPPALADCELAGNVGFDPLNLARNQEQMFEYREAEIKHARLAMLAAAGWPMSELLDRSIADYFGIDSILDQADRVPSVLNGGLEKVSPVWWGFCVGLTAAIDMFGVAKSRSGDPDYFPGKLGFDPLGLYPVDKKGRQRMELAEIKHGRLAMIAVAGFGLQEYVSGLGVIDETPVFFYPFTETLRKMYG